MRAKLEYEYKLQRFPKLVGRNSKILDDYPSYFEDGRGSPKAFADGRVSRLSKISKDNPKIAEDHPSISEHFPTSSDNLRILSEIFLIKISKTKGNTHCLND